MWCGEECEEKGGGAVEWVLTLDMELAAGNKGTSKSHNKSELTEETKPSVLSNTNDTDLKKVTVGVSTQHP